VPAMRPGRDGLVGHYLRRNDKQWSPPAVITFDTESYRQDRGDGENQTLRLWCARLDDRRPPHRGEAAQLRQRGQDGAQLAATVDEWLRGRRTCWLYCHNLGYDLTTSELVGHLAALGWAVEHCSTAPQYIFLTMAKGDRRLTLTDLHHLLPMRLADIGQLLDIPKGQMPSESDPDEIWAEYCARDVDVLAAAVLALMDHWDAYGLGNWALSGAACGFRAMRHMLPAKSITLIDSPDSSANERAAIYGGRRYCWRHGDQPPGRYSELDFTMAHATTAANYVMPVKRGSWFDSLPMNHRAIDSDLAVIIAEVEIETDVPRFPVRAGGRVWYPVGRFKTTLASPDIAWARDLGCLRSIGRGQFHYTSGVLRPFFRRVIETGAPGNDQYPDIVRAMWKQWGRSVAGKFGQRGYKVTPTNMLSDKPWHYEKATDWETGEEYWLVHYGGIVHEAHQDGDGASAYPAVLAVIESHERVALGKAAELLGPGVVIQCDTDGLWVDMGALEGGAETGFGFDLADMDRRARVAVAIDIVNKNIGALQLREKHSVQRMAIWGPQNYDAGPHSRHSGRPRGLREVRDGVWAGDIFPAVSHQMATAAPGVFRTETVSWSRPACVTPGWVTVGGAVRAVEVRSGPGGCTDLVPYSETRWAAAGDQLGPEQHQALEGLWDAVSDTGEVSNGRSAIWARTADEAAAANAARRAGVGLAPARDAMSPVP
jgi:hypothetical protein